ncbi:MAG TPA: lipopolysaccharide biosynthesis protein [Casimicrobiaceae bacterium]
MNVEHSNLGRRMARGAVWTVFMRLTVRSIGMVSMVVLARLLVPADFGLVVLASMLLGFVELLSEFEFGTFLIREQGIDRSYYDTAWTLSLVRGGLTALLLVISASVAADFFGEPRLQNILYVLGLASLLSGLANIGTVDFQKSLDFDRDFRLLVQTRLVSFVITILLAVLLRNYWALVIGTLSGRGAALLFSYTMHPYRPRISLARSGAILRFSRWVLANNLLYFAQRQGFAFVIGKMLDSASLGLYSLAREVSALATSELVVPIGRAMLPGLSALKNDPDAMQRTFLEALSMVVMLALPLGVGIALTADPLVRVAMGPKWLEAIPVMQILAVVGIARVVTSNSDSHLLALNLPHLTTVLACFGAVVGILSMLWAAPIWGLIAAAWATSATAAFQLVLNYAIMWRAAGISPAAVGTAIWRAVSACLVMSAAVLVLLQWWPYKSAIVELFLELCCAFVLGALVYVATLLVLWRASGSPPGAEKHTLQMVSSLARRLRARRAAGRY